MLRRRFDRISGIRFRTNDSWSALASIVKSVTPGVVVKLSPDVQKYDLCTPSKFKLESRGGGIVTIRSSDYEETGGNVKAKNSPRKSHRHPE